MQPLTYFLPTVHQSLKASELVSGAFCVNRKKAENHSVTSNYNTQVGIWHDVLMHGRLPSLQVCFVMIGCKTKSQMYVVPLHRLFASDRIRCLLTCKADSL